MVLTSGGLGQPVHSLRLSRYGPDALSDIADTMLLGCGKWDLALAKAA